MTIQELREKINKAGVDAKAILDAATAASRSLTPDEVIKFDAIDKDRDAMLATESRMVKEEQVQRDLASSAGRKTANVGPDDRATKMAQSRADAMVALQGWFLRAKGKQTERHIEAAKRSGMDLNSREVTINLSEVAMAGLSREQQRTWDLRGAGSPPSEFTGTPQVIAGASPDDGSLGGFTVQNELMRSLETALLAFGGMRETAQVIRTNTGARLPWPTVNDTSNEGEIIDEGGAVNDQDVVFGQLVLEAYKYSSKRLAISVELLQDSTVNMAGTIGSMLGERIGRITNRHFTVGTGNGQPKGIVTAAANSNVSLVDSPAGVTYDNLVDIEHSVDPAYRRPNGRWMFADDTLRLIKKIKTEVTKEPIWLPGLAVAAPDTILGYPYTINQHMASVGSPAAKAILFGALNKYIIRDVREVTLVRLDEIAAHMGLVVFLAFSRHDGDLLDAGTHPVKFAE